LQKANPCHGLLVTCDEGTQSIDELMEQCEELQLTEKNSARRLPVAIVFWPPPSPIPWSRLLNIQPVRLHRIAGDAPTNLPDFIAEVWQVRKVMP
jgi:hypothetical protein